MAKNKASADAATLELIAEVKRRKAEISKAEKPNWITNRSFSYSENGGSAINLAVEANVQTLVSIAAYLKDKERAFKATAEELQVEVQPFTWQGFKVSDWVEDVKNRINKIQIGAKRTKLEALEARLNSIISPELKRQMELDAISEELK